MIKELVPAGDITQTVFDFIVSGHSHTHIVEYLKSVGEDDASSKEIIAQAFEKLLDSAELPESARRGWCLEAYRLLYQKLVATGDYSGALKAVKEIANLPSGEETKFREVTEKIKEHMGSLMSEIKPLSNIMDEDE